MMIDYLDALKIRHSVFFIFHLSRPSMRAELPHPELIVRLLFSERVGYSNEQSNARKQAARPRRPSPFNDS